MRCIDLCNKFNLFLKKHRQLIAYVIFGVLTTGVNYLVYFPLYNVACFPATISNIISWFVAVIFAFLTNKTFVYKSNNWSRKVVLPEFLKFLLCRLSSGLLETVILFITVDCLMLNGNVWKVLISVIVVVLNYISGKFLVFR